MTRFSIAFSDREEWMVEALNHLRRQAQSDGPTPSLGSVIRSILSRELSAFRPPDPEELELAAKRANGFCFDPLPMPY